MPSVTPAIPQQISYLPHCNLITLNAMHTCYTAKQKTVTNYTRTFSF